MNKSKINDKSEDMNESKKLKRPENVEVLEKPMNEFIEFMKEFHSIKNDEDLWLLHLRLAHAEILWGMYKPEKDGDPLPKNFTVVADKLLPAMAKANHLTQLFDEYMKK